MIRDGLAVVLVVGGSILTLLGAAGLLRFPDVFTRMHAATKSATVGVIAITAAAALEAATVGGALVLALVVALLFLSGPLGVSMLARAAYHDPETPRSPLTRTLEWQAPVAEPKGVQRVSGTSPLLTAWLFFVWIAAFGAITPGVVVGGIAVAITTTWALRTLAPRWPEALRHPLAAARFVGHFLTQLAKATSQVAMTLFLPPNQLRPAVLEVPLAVKTRNEVSLLMNVISFTPGTVALEFHDGRLFVHVLHAESPEEIVADIKTMERRIIAAFGGRRGVRPAKYDSKIT